jgi:hypothetical protein
LQSYDFSVGLLFVTIENIATDDQSVPEAAMDIEAYRIMVAERFGIAPEEVGDDMLRFRARNGNLDTEVPTTKDRARILGELGLDANMSFQKLD